MKQNLKHLLKHPLKKSYFPQRGPLVVALLFLLTACNQEAPPSLPEKVIEVTVQAAKKQDVPLELSTIGTILAQERVEIRPQVTGSLTQVSAIEGAMVEAGALLFSIERAPYEAKYEEAEAELIKAHLATEFAQKELEKASKLFETQAISQTEWKNYQEKVLIAGALAAASQARLRVAQLNLDSCQIKSPIAGKIGFISQSCGNLVQAYAKEPIAVVEGISSLAVKAAIPERYAQPFLQKPSPTSCEINLPYDKQNKYRAQISAIDNGIDRQSGTLSFKAKIEGSPPLLPGQAVEVKIKMQTRVQQVVISQTALKKDSEGAYVFIIKDNLAHQQRVKLGLSFAEQVIIEEGLEGQELVVTDGQLHLKEGIKVHVNLT